MSKRPKPGVCIYCLKYFDILTWDHVLPESWYPESTENIEKWKVPSCKACNNRLGKIEEELLIKLGLCLDPNEIKSLGIPDKVLRSLSPEHGKNDDDKRHRKSKRERILREITVFDELPKIGIFPNFGPLNETEYMEYPSVSIYPDELSHFAEKIARGIAFIADGSYIDESYHIELFVLDEQKATEFKTLVDTYGTIYDRRPGMVVKRAIVEKEKVGGIYSIEIWGRFRLYVTVVPKDLDLNLIDSQKP